MALGFYFDMTSCIGCKTCQIACKDKNDLPIGTLFRNIKSYETGEFPKPGAFHWSNSCNHCGNPACVAACASGAMYVHEDGFVLVDAELCDGCGACATACPYSVPKMVDGKANKCDTCAAIRANGNDPQCVSSCIMRALEFGDIADLMAAHPDAVTLDKLPFAPASETVPGTLVTPKAFALEDGAIEVII